MHLCVTTNSSTTRAPCMPIACRVSGAKLSNYWQAPCCGIRLERRVFISGGLRTASRERDRLPKQQQYDQGWFLCFIRLGDAKAVAAAGVCACGQDLFFTR